MKYQFEGLNIHEAIEKAETLRKESPERISKPTLKNNPTSQDKREYAKKLAEYENQLEPYKELKKNYR